MESDASALDRVVASYQPRELDLLALDEALQDPAEFNSEMARAVELRYLAGLEMEQIAEVLDMPKRTLEREWAAARAWLHARMS
jgi:RNA polymerase sigma-70 factor, ECF subfamily